MSVFRPAFRLPDGGRVIVASEDAQRRDALAKALTHDGHRVAEARAPLELFVLAGLAGPSLRHPPADVVVLDVSGQAWATPELLDALRLEPGGIPIVALIDPADPSARAACERVEAAAVLDLPVDLARLRAEVLGIVQPFTRKKEAAMPKLRLSLALASALVLGVVGADLAHATTPGSDPPRAVTLFGKTWSLDPAPPPAAARSFTLFGRTWSLPDVAPDPDASPVTRWLRELRGRLEDARASMRASNDPR